MTRHLNHRMHGISLPLWLSFDIAVPFKFEEEELNEYLMAGTWDSIERETDEEPTQILPLLTKNRFIKRFIRRCLREKTQTLYAHKFSVPRELPCSPLTLGVSMEGSK
ncbi:hypothetical protein AHAS_Ahas18G0103900 [Arachis hypogaea]